MIDPPTFPAQHGRDPSVSVSAKPLSKANDGSGQSFFIISDSGSMALGGSRLAQHLTGPTLRYLELRHCLIHTSPAPERA